MFYKFFERFGNVNKIIGISGKNCAKLTDKKGLFVIFSAA